MPMLEKLILELGDELAMKELITETDDHHFHLPFENGIEVEAVPLQYACALKGVIGECPEKNGEAFRLKAMEANLFGVGTRGAVIGLKEDGKKLTLSLEIEDTASYKDFKEKLEDFVSVIAFWRNEALKHQ